MGDSSQVGFWKPTTLTHMTEDNWETVLKVVQAVRSRRGRNTPQFSQLGRRSNKRRYARVG
jgi:hypothetical protein